MPKAKNPGRACDLPLTYLWTKSAGAKKMIKGNRDKMYENVAKDGASSGVMCVKHCQ